jgi:hypothetical protein
MDLLQVGDNLMVPFKHSSPPIHLLTCFSCAEIWFFHHLSSHRPLHARKERFMRPRLMVAVSCEKGFGVWGEEHWVKECSQIQRAWSGDVRVHSYLPLHCKVSVQCSELVLPCTECTEEAASL